MSPIPSPRNKFASPVWIQVKKNAREFHLKESYLISISNCFSTRLWYISSLAFVGYQKRKLRITEESLLFEVVSLEYSSQEEVSNINFLPVWNILLYYFQHLMVHEQSLLLLVTKKKISKNEKSLNGKRCLFHVPEKYLSYYIEIFHLFSFLLIFLLQIIWKLSF